MDIYYKKCIAKYKLHYKKRLDVDLFFPLDVWPKHLVLILFKLHISGSSGDSETGHKARFKIVMFLFFNGLQDPISYIQIFQANLTEHVLRELRDSLQYIKDIVTTQSEPIF